MDAATQETLVGRTIAGKYLIQSFVGGGAMGAVFRASQTALDKRIAIKVMHPDLAKEATFALRFHREAKAASRLDHPNSMRVVDFGEEPDGLLYIAMEYLEGRDLYKVIREDWPLSPARVVSVLSQALAALAVAHDMGVIHRDLKPENIMILAARDDEGHEVDQVKVCDFGIAKLVDLDHDEGEGGAARSERGPRATAQGTTIGTPEYMSPEQAQSKPLDARSDIYSMGVILYQLLTGRVPFDGDSAFAVVVKHITEQPVAPRTLYAGVHPELEAVCLKALEKSPEGRFGSAREMRAALRGAVMGDALGGVLALAGTPTLEGHAGLGLAPTAPLTSVTAGALAAVSAPGAERGGTGTELSLPSGTDAPALASTGTAPSLSVAANALDVAASDPPSRPSPGVTATSTAPASGSAGAPVAGRGLVLGFGATAVLGVSLAAFFALRGSAATGATAGARDDAAPTVAATSLASASTRAEALGPLVTSASATAPLAPPATSARTARTDPGAASTPRTATRSDPPGSATLPSTPEPTAAPQVTATPEPAVAPVATPAPPSATPAPATTAPRCRIASVRSIVDSGNSKRDFSGIPSEATFADCVAEASSPGTATVKVSFDGSRKSLRGVVTSAPFAPRAGACFERKSRAVSVSRNAELTGDPVLTLTIEVACQ